MPGSTNHALKKMEERVNVLVNKLLISRYQLRDILFSSSHLRDSSLYTKLFEVDSTFSALDYHKEFLSFDNPGSFVNFGKYISGLATRLIELRKVLEEIS